MTTKPLATAAAAFALLALAGCSGSAQPAAQTPPPATSTASQTATAAAPSTTTPPPTSAAPAGPGVDITYSVTSDGDIRDVSIHSVVGHDNRGVKEFTPQEPTFTKTYHFTHALDRNNGDELGMQVTAGGTASTVTCTISQDGHVIVQRTNSGGFSTVNCKW